MNRSGEKSKKRFVWLKVAAVFVIVGAVLIIGWMIQSIDTQWLLDFLPQNRFLIILILLGIFTLKSVAFFIPINVLYVVSGALLPTLEAILVNVIGLSIELSITFFLGRVVTKDFVQRIVSKSEKASKMLDMERQTVFTAMLLRMVQVLPIEPLSLVLGSLGYRYPVFLAGSLMGMVPGMIPFAFMGNAIDHIFSKEFLIPFFCAMAISFGMAFLYNIYDKKVLQKKLDASSADNKKV